MPEMVGIRFRPAGALFYFLPGDLSPKVGQTVIVEAERGLMAGRVVRERQTPKTRPADPWRRIVRLADERDELIERENKARNKTAFDCCRRLIDQLALPMKLIEVEYQHSANKATFYFSAEGRVDFRELVRLLAQDMRIRVEMRQVGIRDEAKLIGGFGPCGLTTCCSTFIEAFTPVSIRMAKEQNLTLNPEKVSGSCGRLMCCLDYEQSTYREIQKGLPKIGKKVDTWKGRGRVLEINIFSRLMRLELEGREYLTISVDDYFAFKADPEGFAKVIAEREEQAKSAAIQNATFKRRGGASRPPRSGTGEGHTVSEHGTMRMKPAVPVLDAAERDEPEIDDPDAPVIVRPDETGRPDDAGRREGEGRPVERDGQRRGRRRGRDRNRPRPEGAPGGPQSGAPGGPQGGAPRDGGANRPPRPEQRPRLEPRPRPEQRDGGGAPPREGENREAPDG
ncbi:MAG: hypothetical protein C4523_01520, partial [Myxococcales bacterium]